MRYYGLKKDEWTHKRFRLHEKLMEQETLSYFRVIIFNLFFQILLKVACGSNRKSCTLLQFLKIKVEPIQPHYGTLREK